MFDHGVEGAERLVGAQPLQEVDAEVLAVEVAVEVEEVGFDQAGAAVDGGPGADVGDRWARRGGCWDGRSGSGAR